jgi:ADP-ribose pyrophosphatase
MKRVLFEGKFLRLLDDDSWEFSDRPASAGVAAVIAVDGDKLLLVEQFRHAQQAAVIQLPGGLIDRAGSGNLQETAIEAGRRELREETGYVASTIEELFVGPNSPGMTTETITFVLAQGLRWTGGQLLDADEEIRLHRVPLAHLSDWLREKAASGVQIDLRVFAGLHFLASHRGHSFG